MASCEYLVRKILSVHFADFWLTALLYCAENDDFYFASGKIIEVQSKLKFSSLLFF